jgi:hypothetical protein
MGSKSFRANAHHFQNSILLKKEKIRGSELIHKYYKDASYLLPSIDETQVFIDIKNEDELKKVTPEWVKDLCPDGFISMQ